MTLTPSQLRDSFALYQDLDANWILASEIVNKIYGSPETNDAVLQGYYESLTPEEQAAWMLWSPGGTATVREWYEVRDMVSPQPTVSWHSYLVQYELPGGSTARKKSFRFNRHDHADQKRALREAKEFARHQQWWRIDAVTQTILEQAVYNEG